jgi:hypothetical protein
VLRGRSGRGVTTYVIDKAGDAGTGQQKRRMKASGEVGSQHESRREQRATTNVDQVLAESFPASDPPSWTSSISRVASNPKRHPSNERLLHRIRAEFLEMPGLCLTFEQAQRLWSLESRTCEALLTSLIDSRFLRRTDRGLFACADPEGRGSHAAPKRTTHSINR